MLTTILFQVFCECLLTLSRPSVNLVKVRHKHPYTDMNSKVIWIEKTSGSHPLGFYYVIRQGDSVVSVFCGLVKDFANRLGEILDEVFWYKSLEPCKTCGTTVDYNEMASRRLKVARDYAKTTGLELTSLVDAPFTKGLV